MTVRPTVIYKVFIAFGSQIISLVSTWIVVCFQGNCRPQSARTGMVLSGLVFIALGAWTLGCRTKTTSKNRGWSYLPALHKHKLLALADGWYLKVALIVSFWLCGLQSILNIGSWSCVWTHVKHLELLMGNSAFHLPVPCAVKAHIMDLPCAPNWMFPKSFCVYWCQKVHGKREWEREYVMNEGKTWKMIERKQHCNYEWLNGWKKNGVSVWECHALFFLQF